MREKFEVTSAAALTRLGELADDLVLVLHAYEKHAELGPDQVSQIDAASHIFRSIASLGDERALGQPILGEEPLVGSQIDEAYDAVLHAGAGGDEDARAAFLKVVELLDEIKAGAAKTSEATSARVFFDRLATLTLDGVDDYLSIRPEHTRMERPSGLALARA